MHVRTTTFRLFLLLGLCTTCPLVAHEGPDPLLRFRFDESAVKLDAATPHVQARLGPNAKLGGKARFIDDEHGGSIYLYGGEAGLNLADNFRDLELILPQQAFTVSAWVSVDRPQRWGGLVSVVQDNGSDEAGWVLGYDNEVFTLGLATHGGAGRMTYLTGQTRYELGKLYHVVAVYDGKSMQLFVNGRLDAETSEQSGDVRYPKAAPFVIGAYKDDNEYYGHRGRMRDVALYGAAAKPAWVAQEFGHHASLASLPAAITYDPLAFEVAPYLQMGTQTSMTVMWRTNRPVESAALRWGETDKCSHVIEVDGDKPLQEWQISDLEPETQYFYLVECQAAGRTVKSEVATFQTAVRQETPFAFAVISDTQGNPEVSGKLSSFAWGQRPNFLLHPGDLVSTGPNDEHWTQHFFPGMAPLIQYVPFFPVLGNHEQNAQNYFDYVSLPEPEYFYTFTYGNTQFFMIDSNRNVGPDSEQYAWLNESLAKSTATWKFVCHHHPPYSSDENDYGNLWKTNVGTRGDTRVRQLVPLYEKHNVDFVWNGHIHSYERTWPIREGRAVQNSDGPIYMITGGGGGSLETPGPIRPFFQNTVRHGHHYTMVRINGKSIEIQVYDLENRLFDSLSITK